MTQVWIEGFDAILDSYLGKLPETFSVDGKEFTAKTYAESLPIDQNDYVMVTSFRYRPYYSPFVLEVPDNWSWGKTYNVPLDELVEIADFSIDKGYSVTWSTDISEKGFDYYSGMAVAPRILYKPVNKEEEKMVYRKSRSELAALFFDLNNPVEELEVTEEIRQSSFDNYSTQDDHGMHILGLAKDKNGKEYYYVKNSWGQDNLYGGYIYVSKAYFEYKTISIMVNKEAIPVDIRKKLNI